MQINPQRLVRGESKYLKASQVPDRRSAHFNISGKDVSFKENITTVILFFVTQKKPSVTWRRLSLQSPDIMPFVIPKAMFPAPIKPIFICRSISGSILI